MCSTFIQHRVHCPTSNAPSKSQYEAPKQLLQLRIHRPPKSVVPQKFSEWYFTPISSYQHSEVPRKFALTYIEKDKRGFTMNSAPQHHYQAFDRPAHHQSRKTLTGPLPLMRTPSSGFSSASSSENMLSGLSITSDGDEKIRDILDPSVEVDLDMFLLPDVRYKQTVQQTASTSRTNLSQASRPTQSGATTRQIGNYPASKPSPFNEYSYSNVKRSQGYVDYMPTTHSATATSHPSTSSVPMSPGTWIRCQYCWETYVKLCQRVASKDPVVTCDGPWQWHNLYDSHGRVTCPRLWFTQLDRAGSDMLQKLATAPV